MKRKINYDKFYRSQVPDAEVFIRERRRVAFVEQQFRAKTRELEWKIRAKEEGLNVMQAHFDEWEKGAREFYRKVAEQEIIPHRVNGRVVWLDAGVEPLKY